MSNGLTFGHCLIRDWHSSRIRRSAPFPIHFRVIPRHRNRFLFQFTVHVTCSVEAGHGHQSWWWCHFPDVLYLFASPLHFTRPPFTLLAIKLRNPTSAGTKATPKEIRCHLLNEIFTLVHRALLLIIRHFILLLHHYHLMSIWCLSFCFCCCCCYNKFTYNYLVSNFLENGAYKLWLRFSWLKPLFGGLG